MLRRAPLATLVVPLMAGIWMADQAAFGWWWVAMTVAALMGMVLTSRSAWGTAVCRMALWLGLGVMLSELHQPLRQPSHYAHLAQPDSRYRLEVVSPPQTTRKGQKMEAKVLLVDGVSATGKVMLFVDGKGPLRFGQVLEAQSRLVLPSGSENPYQFDYARYLRHKKITHQMFLHEGDWRLCDTVMGGIRYRAMALRSRLLERLSHTRLSPSERGIAEALLLGWKGDVDDATNRQFRDAGITHLLCVSGLHVGLLVMLLGWLLFWIRRGPLGLVVCGTVQLLGVWAFAMVTGFAPATTRAALMFSIFVVGKMFQLHQNAYNSLAASALVLLTVNPGLLWDVGFQLSYAAVLGIVAFYGPMRDLVPWRVASLEELLQKEGQKALPLVRTGAVWMVRKVWALLCVTTSAQVATLPLTLYYFHRFPTYFAVANVTIVPFAGLLLATAIGVLVFPHGLWAVSLLRWELAQVDAITRWVASLPGAVVERIGIDEWTALTLAVMVVLLALWTHLRKRGLWLAVLALMLGLSVYVRLQQSGYEKQEMVLRYKAGRHTAVEVVHGRESTLIADREVAEDPGLIDYQSENFLIRRHVRRTKIVCADTCEAFVWGDELYRVEL